MGKGPVLNPIRAANEINPPPTLSRAERGLARRIAAFEAHRAAQEAQMAGPGGMVQDLNPGVAHQTKATFVPKQSTAPPAPPQEAFVRPPIVQKQAKTRIPERPNRSAVQRIAPMPEPDTGPTIFDEMAADFGTVPAEPLSPPAPDAPAPAADAGVEAILARFKGTDQERLAALAKSYHSSEQRMRQLENERKLFTTGQPVQTQAPAPVQQQVAVTPQFNYKRFEEEILDRGKGAAVAKDFEDHILKTIKSELAGPLHVFGQELIDNKLFRKYPDVVSEENLDMIRAMAAQEHGDAWERSVKAVEKYRGAMSPNQTPPANTNDVQAMQSAAQTPTPQARPAGGKKMYKESAIRAEMQRRIRSGEYTRDPQWRNLVDQAYREGRVQRGV